MGNLCGQLVSDDPKTKYTKDKQPTLATGMILRFF